MDTRKINLCILVTVIIMLSLLIYSIRFIEDKNLKLDNNYIAVFRGEKNNKIYSTYVYDKSYFKDGKYKIKYKFINTEIVTNNFDSVNSNETVTKKGTVKSRKKLIKKVKKHHATNYVIEKPSNKVYQYDEFINRWYHER